MLRFVKSLARRRTLQVLVGLIVAYFVVAWYTEWRWRKYCVEARARGVKLTLPEWFDRPPVTDAENFAALPMFIPKFGEPGYMPRLPYTSWGKPGPAGPPKFALAPYRKSMVKEHWVTPEEDTGSDAEVVLRGLRMFENQFRQLREGASRPHARFIRDWRDNGEAESNYVSKLGSLITALDLKIKAELTVGNPVEALADWQDGWTLVRSLDEDNSLSLFIGGRHGMILAMDVWFGLQRGAWSDAQLLAIERTLAAQNFLARYPAVLAKHRADWNTTLEGCLEKDAGQQRLSWFFSTNPRPGPDGKLIKLLAKQDRWWRKNQLWINRFFDEEATSADAAAERWRPRAERKYDPEELADGCLGADLFAAREIGKIYVHAASEVTFYHTYLRLAGLGCALERCRRATGQYPETLAELVPKFVPQLPHELTSGEPFRYSRDAQEGYLLYSVGLNNLDELGRAGDEEGIKKEWPDWRWWAPKPASP